MSYATSCSSFSWSYKLKLFHYDQQRICTYYSRDSPCSIYNSKKCSLPDTGNTQKETSMFMKKGNWGRERKGKREKVN